MAFVTLTQLARSYGQSVETIYYSVAIAGTYATGGVVVDLTLQNDVKGNRVPLAVNFNTSNGAYGNYVPGADAATGKLILFAAAGTEVAAGAIGAPWTTDTGMRMQVQCARGGTRP